MSELYLIAHKVRGAPAFDIAIQMEMEDEIWWILPSTGHRAYPYWFSKLADELGTNAMDFLTQMPDDCPDFYEVTTPILTAKAERANRQSGVDLLSTLGLNKNRPHPSVQGKLERRI